MADSQAPAGLIHALSLNGRGGATALPWKEVEQWSPGEGGCLWLHFDYENPAAIDWLTDGSGLHEIASSALLTKETRPRTLRRGDHLLLSLRGVNLSSDSEPEDMISVRLWTDGKRLISTRKRKMRSTEDVLGELEAGDGPRTVTELLVAWIERIIDRMKETIDDIEDQMLALEEELLGGQTSGLRLKIAQLRKQSIGIRRYLAPQREALNRLTNESFSWLDEINRLRLREANDRLIRYIEDIDEVRDRAAVAQEELVTRVSEQMNQRSYVFTVVATIFLPLGFFTGLMGINVGGMPGVESDAAFWVVVGMCAGVVVALAILFRLNRWL